MKKYLVDYIDLEGDLTHVHVMAFSVDDAKEEVRHDYWDIAEILDVREDK